MLEWAAGPKKRAAYTFHLVIQAMPYLAKLSVQAGKSLVASACQKCWPLFRKQGGLGPFIQLSARVAASACHPGHTSPGLQGFGDSRQIHIMPAGNAQEATPTQSGPDSHGDVGEASGASELAKQIYTWCQEEGPTYWRYSHSEIRQMLHSDHSLPPDIQQLITKRCQCLLTQLIWHL